MVFSGIRLDDRKWRSVSGHRQCPDVGQRVRSDGVVQHEPSVAGKVRRTLALSRGRQRRFASHAGGRRLVESITPVRFELNTMRDPSGDQIGLASVAASEVSRLTTRRRRSNNHTSEFPLSVRPIATRRPSGDISGVVQPECTGSPAFSISRPDLSKLNQVSRSPPTPPPTPPPAKLPGRYATAPPADADTVPFRAPRATV